MATTLHLCKLKTPINHASSRRALHCQSLFPQQTLSMASRFELFRNVRDSCGRRVLRASCNGGKLDVLERKETNSQRCDDDGVSKLFSCVMKFGGSSVASAERMREVADLIRSFPEERPVIVLSAMGKTTNKLLQAGEKAVRCGVTNASSLEELNFIKNWTLRRVQFFRVEPFS